MATAAGGATGTGPTIRREILHILAGATNFRNHETLMTANAADRVLSAGVTAAQLNARSYIQKK